MGRVLTAIFFPTCSSTNLWQQPLPLRGSVTCSPTEPHASPCDTRNLVVIGHNMKTFICLFAVVVFFTAFTFPLHATNPRLSGGVRLCAGCGSPWPCQTVAACSANTGAEILYNAPTSSSGCQEIWSMNTIGGNKINLTAKMSANGFGNGPMLNQGTPTYSPDGQWMIFPAQATGSIFPCSAHAVAPGAGIDFEIRACDTATYGNCAIILTVIVGVGHGAVHPQLTRDGNTLSWGMWMGTSGTTPEGNAGFLQWATFIPGTPPSISSTIHQSDFAGDGTGNKNWYEPADSDGAIGTPTCWVYVTTDRAFPTTALADVAIARYSLGGPACPSAGTFNFVSTPYETAPGCYSEFWSFNQRLDSAITISSCLLTGSPSPPSVLDIVMAMGASGAGAILLTGYNLAEQPEYGSPILVSNPHQSADGSYIVFNLVTNASLQGQLGGFGGATGNAIWKYNITPVPVQAVGNTSLAGKAGYK
jgi:hypothetical protein